MYKLLTLSWVLCLACPALLFAQTARHLHVTGLVADSASGAAADFLTVRLVSGRDSVLQAVLTRQGRFAFSDVPPGSYFLTVQGLGYRSLRLPLLLADDADSLTRDAGVIRIASQDPALEAVEILGLRPIVKPGLGMISYDVQADPAHAGRNVLEMLPGVPYLSVNAEGRILLKGSTGFRFLLNGKPSGALERNPEAFLRSLPAASVQRIEVITIPSARYEAEGLSGLVNIITLRQQNSGYQGSWNANYRFPAGGPGSGANLTLRKGTVALSAYGGGALHYTPLVPTVYQRTSEGPLPAVLSQASTRESAGRSAYLGAEWSWEPSRKWLISGQFNAYGDAYSDELEQESALRAADSLLSGYRIQTRTQRGAEGMDAGLTLQHSFPQHKGRMLTGAYRYLAHGTRYLPEASITNRTAFLLPDFRQHNAEQFGEHTAQADYVHPFRQMLLEFGAKAIRRSNRSSFDYQTLDTLTLDYQPVAERSDAFSYQQQVYSLYHNALYQGEHWGFSGGLRLELTQVAARFRQAGPELEQTYLNPVPSLILSRTLKNGSLQGGFSQRIRRPSIVRLNPFVDQSNPGIETSGNPELRPVLLNTLMLNYSYSGALTFNAGLSYAFFRSLDLRVYELDAARQVTRVTYANTGRGSSTGLDVYLQWPVSKQLSVSLNGNILYFDLGGTVQGTLLANTWWTAYAAPSFSLNAGHGWSASGSMTFSSPSPSAFQGTQNGLIASSLGLNKTLFRDRFTLSASVSNPLRRFRDQILLIEGLDFAESSTTREYFRSFSCSAQYTFGELREGVRKSRRGIRNDDVSTK
ncbi:MAG: outer membrane beta-barrel protein [Bacteroidia bacterium]|nr:outer membrane beta-barrel protein [Bacteroidia bacterium]